MKVDFSFLGTAFKGKPDLLMGYIQSVEQELEGSIKDMLKAIDSGDLDGFRRAHHRIKPQLESMGCTDLNRDIDKLKNHFSVKYLKEIGADKKFKTSMEEVMDSLRSYAATAI